MQATCRDAVEVESVSKTETIEGHPSSREARTLLLTVRRYWWFVILVTLLATGLTWVLTQRQQPTYETSAEVLLRTSEAEFLFRYSESAPADLIRSPRSELLYVQSQAFRSTARALSPASVRMSPRVVESTLRFGASGPSPSDVAEAANLWASLYVTERQADIERSTLEELAFLAESIEMLEAELDEVSADIALLDDLIERTVDPDTYTRLLTQRVSLENLLRPQTDPIEQELSRLRQNRAELEGITRFFEEDVGARVERAAQEPSSPTSPNVMRNLILGAVLGAILGTVAPFLRLTVAGRLQSRDELGESTELPALTTIPRYKASTREGHIEVLDNPTSGASVQYQALMTAIEFAAREHPISTLMVTSPSPGDGKTTTAVNIAAVAAQYLNVLLVDGDMRRPTLHSKIGVPNEQGLADVLEGADIAESRCAVQRDGIQLDVLTAGQPTTDPALLLRQASWSRLVSSLFLYDLVVIDAPPVLAVTDSLLLGQCVDAQLLVTRARGTRRAEVTEAAELLSSNSSRILGVVVNAEGGQGARYRYYGAD